VISIIHGIVTSIFSLFPVSALPNSWWCILSGTLSR